MPTLDFIHPLDQPFGNVKDRAIEWIRAALGCGDYSSLRLAVAYAKLGALTRLKPAIEKFQSDGGTVDAVIGIDQGGTSIQALQFAIDNFDSVMVWQHPSPSLTFHPKFYIFEGTARGEVQIGSCNLTAGGLEANCESAVRIRYALPTEREGWLAATAGWTSLTNHPNALPLDQPLLQKLANRSLLLDESTLSGLRMRVSLKSSTPVGGSPIFPATVYRPASPLPAPSRPATPRQKKVGSSARPVTVTSPSSGPVPQALLIQIVPHHNGEVFLSKQAVDQQHAFFGYPWTGTTTPKKSTNAPYEQRNPDPVMEWTVFDASGSLALHVPGLGINTVFYTQRAEIRITVNPQLRQAIAPLSILKMERADPEKGIDYVCEVHPPGSPQFINFLQLCNQTMPSGGRADPRRFGWI